MSNPYVTTTQGKFPVQDITFKNARRQSEVAREIAEERGDVATPEGVPVPVSLTPEQVKKFLTSKCEVVEPNERRVYEQTLRWIDELLETRKRLIALELKQVKDNSDTSNDIEGDTV